MRKKTDTKSLDYDYKINTFKKYINKIINIPSVYTLNKTASLT